MRWMVKQLVIEFWRQKVMTSFLVLLAALTSLAFFFVRFTVDRNLHYLADLLQTGGALAENEQRYYQALLANRSLANSFLVSMLMLSALVCILFFCRFFRANRQQLGLIKALGFQNYHFSLVFMLTTVLLALPGTLLGLGGGYLLSDVLLLANRQNYEVSWAGKGLATGSILLGTLLVWACLAVVAGLTVLTLRNQETALLLSGQPEKVPPAWLVRGSERLVSRLPEAHRPAVRLALRKPLVICLLLGAVLGYSICMLIGGSLGQISQSQLTSARINQLIGGVAGTVLILLALLLSAQDSRRDRQILTLMGHDKKELRQLFVAVYEPIIALLFLVTLGPAWLAAKGIQMSLGRSIGEYLPFHVSGGFLLVTFLLLMILARLVVSLSSR